MPRDRGGVGRTGNKAKVAAAKRAAAAEAARTTASKSPAAEDAPATNDKEEEQQVTAAAEDPISENTRPRRRSRIRKVRFVVDRPPKPRRGRPYEWTWGRKLQRACDWTRQSGRPEYRPIVLARIELRAHLWGVRFAEHVAAGCVGKCSISYDTDMAWVAEKTHRLWCPDALPDPMLRVGRWCRADSERELYYMGKN